MFKHVKKIIGVILTTALISAGTGFSLWAFGQIKNNTFESTANVDLIKENHNYGKPNPKASFDMYFFPSSYYMFHQMKHFEYKEALKNNDTAKITEYTPYELDAEELYGSVEKQFTNGILTTSVRFKNGFGGSNVTDPTKQYYTDYLTRLNNIETKYSNAPKASESYTHSYDAKRHSHDNASGGDGNRYADDDNVNGTPFVNEIPNFSSPLEDAKDTAGSRKFNLVNEIDGSYEGGDWETHEIESRYPRYQFLDLGERLGYWYDLHINEGRLLPIKYSFTGTLNASTFEKIIPLSPYSDMIDNQRWFNYQFADWVYISEEIDKTTNKVVKKSQYTIPGQAFSYRDSVNVFNIFDDLTKIGEKQDNSNHYVIRLFPTFTNGKDARMGNNTIYCYPDRPNYLNEGRRDPFKLDYVLEDKNAPNYCIPVTRYFTYSNNYNNPIYDPNKTPFTVSTLENFTINSANFKNATVKEVMVRGIKVRGLNNPSMQNGTSKIGSSWQGRWINMPIYDYVDIDGNNLLKKLQSGIYNIYIFSTQNDYETEQQAKDALNVLTAEGQFLSNLGKYFPLLKGKNMIRVFDQNSHNVISGNHYKDNRPVTKNINPYMQSGNEHWKTTESQTDPNGQVTQVEKDHNVRFKRAYAMFLEEVTQVRVNTSLPINEITTGTKPTYEFANGIDYEAEAMKTFDEMEAFHTLNSDLFVGNYDSTNKNFTSSGTNLKDTNPYCYKLENLKLDSNNDKYLQFRFRSGYQDTTLKFELDPLGYSNSAALFEGDLNKGVALDESNVYFNASKFFDLINVKTNNPKLPYQRVLKLKNNISGYYNIILDFTIKNNSPVFNVYVYRQKNIFVKIFNKSPEIGTDGLINHNPNDISYYTKSYYLGTNIDWKDNFQWVDKQVQVQNQSLRLREIFTLYVGIREQATDFTNDYKSKSGTYYLVDHTSKQIVGRYKTANESGTTEITFSPSFKIEKNYIFYVMSKEAYAKEFYIAFPYSNINI